MKLAEGFLKAGDVIEVCGFALKEEVLAQRSSPNDAAPPPVVHGHVLVMSDRRMQPWGPYGKLDNCVRPNDPTQLWLDFVNSDPMGREYWCRSRAFGKLAPGVSAVFLAEIDRLMAVPCA